jgi:hypothetical protein
MTINEEESIEIQGQDCWTIQQFAKLTKRRASTIRGYIAVGNTIRKINTIRVGGKPFIPVREVFEYPFIVSGRPGTYGKMVCRYKLVKDEDTGSLTLLEETLPYKDKDNED